MSIGRTPAALGRRACALLAASSALLHALMLGHAGNPVVGGLLAVMIVGCLACAVDLWRKGAPSVWCMVALMNLAMIALHTPMPSHHHGAVAMATQSTLMGWTVSLALVEVMIAGTVLYYSTRNRWVAVAALRSGPA